MLFLPKQQPTHLKCGEYDRPPSPFTALSPPREIELHRPSDLMEKNSKKKKTLLKALIFIPQAFLPALKAQCIFSPNYFYLCIVLNTF